MPPDGLKLFEHKEILSFEEILRIVKIAVNRGLTKIRITGGEPLVRKNVIYFIKLLKNIEGIRDLSLTTNGILLDRYAEELVDAGLKRVNISLDSLRPERFREITRGGDISNVLNGIKAAERAGLTPIKINMVPIHGINDDEIEDFARMTMESSYQIRFIEFMPFGTQGMWKPEKFISSDDIKNIVERAGRLTPVAKKKSGPARYFKFDGAAGIIGFISPLSNHFCAECNRLRLTADGKLRPCLFSETEIDLKPALRGNVSDDEIERLIKLSIDVKPKRHNITIQNAELRTLMSSRQECMRPMSKIGG